MTTENAREAYNINSLERGLEALFGFLAQPEMTFSAFSRTCGLNKASAKRILYTLEKNGYVQFNEIRNTYSLGIRVFELGTVAREQLTLLRIARPLMETICAEINETVFVSQKVGYEQIYLHKIEAQGTVRLPTFVGHRRPLYYGLGKAILAYACDEEQVSCLPEVIPSYSLKTISEREKFLEELKSIREKGYAIDEEEYIEGVVGIGVPVFSAPERVFGLVGIAGPTLRMTCEKRDYVIKLLHRVSKTTSLKLQETLEQNL